MDELAAHELVVNELAEEAATADLAVEEEQVSDDILSDDSFESAIALSPTKPATEPREFAASLLPASETPHNAPQKAKLKETESKIDPVKGSTPASSARTPALGTHAADPPTAIEDAPDVRVDSAANATAQTAYPPPSPSPPSNQVLRISEHR